MSAPLCLTPWLLRRGLPTFVFVEQLACLPDIGLLPLLRPAHEEGDQLIPVLDYIEPVSWPPVDPIFAKPTADPFDVRQVALFYADDGGCHPGCGVDLKIIEPAPERAGAILANIVLNNDTAPPLVTYALPSV